MSMRTAPGVVGHRRRLAIAAIAAVGAVLAGCTTHPAQPLSAAALAGARTFNEYTVYWAGTEVDGVHLTEADSPKFFYAPVGFTMYYGDCEDRGSLKDGGCTLPLKITTSIYSPHSDASFGTQRWLTLHGVPAVIFRGGKSIEIYVSRKDIDIVADSAARAMAAAVALQPFNRVLSVPFPPPQYTPNVAPVQTGATVGPTGATTDIAPPPELEPVP